VRRKLLYDTMKKLIDPERHCVDQDENGQLDADQNGEKILWKDTSIYATQVECPTRTYRVYPQDIFRRTGAPKCMLAINLVYVSKGCSRVVRGNNEYFVKAPGEDDGYNESIPVQNKVRDLKVD
jgi:hypothetical protein